MKRLFLLLFFLNILIAVNAQKYMTKNGYIGFYSHTPMEDIKADNNQVAGVLDITTGDMVFQVLIKSCLLYTSPSPRDRTRSRMPSSA